MNLLHQHGLSLLLVLSSMVVVSQTANITLGSSLLASKDSSSSWLSPSGEFAFGFRATNNDQNVYLLAVWYDKIPDKTIVWWANGDNPAPEGSKIELTTRGQFMLTGPKGEEIPLPMSIADDEISYAALLDTGNFVLVKSSSYVWESFKNPTDTLLPTRVLEIGGKLTSRQMDRNYSKGKFQLRIQDDGDVVLQPIAPATDFAYEPYFNSKTTNNSDRMDSGYRLVLNESGFVNVVRRNGNTLNIANKTQAPSGDFY
ncbi:G-type lectin S-receptor-like serine/threonine-protein kinase LECRK3 [Neltuma alba]|uniref:G-type lectin S-receptor-like serine/threonine-protein kinase LECRK3 n=1 Tax=Neltuma alba TaxID=207710 RepID=UPI0010A3C08F|nr:G-type lectin S-receptor-like serine/threonine-protein kinase LECRK3 [Prosopis alba]